MWAGKCAVINGWVDRYAGFCHPDPLPEREWRPSIYERRCRRPPAAYPDTRAGSPQTCPVWPCSGWGLPSLPGHPGSWWSLTPPFHPYLPFTVRAPMRRAVCSLWHWPAGHPEWALPTTLPCGARTFLEPLPWRATAWSTHPRSSLPASCPAEFSARATGKSG